MSEIEEVAQTIEQLRQSLEQLVVRGLRASGPQHLGALKTFEEEFARIGAEYLAGHISGIRTAIERDDPKAAASLLRTQAALRVFERILTLEVATVSLEDLLTDENEDEDA